MRFYSNFTLQKWRFIMNRHITRKYGVFNTPLLAAGIMLAMAFIFSCSGDDGGGDNTGESKYDYCITADNICLAGPFTASTCAGQPSNNCPYTSYSSSLDGSSSSTPSSSSVGSSSSSVQSSSSVGGSSSSSGGGAIINLEEALRAKPVASNYGEPEILDSWTKGDRNYYVIYAGEIRNTFVSEIAYVHYIGFPIGFSKTTVTEKAVTNSMTKTVSNSIVFSNTSQTKSTLDAAIKAKFKIVDFSVGLKLEESMTNSVSNTKSTETSISSVTSTVETEASTISFEIGNHDEAVGHYRYSLYDVSDVYFFISTSLDNDALLSWDVISCTRGSYLRHWEYSTNGNFDNSPIAGSEIVFAEDFYKTLQKPTTVKTVERNVVEFTTTGNHTYTFNESYPATIEVYALGAGGGGQGGHRYENLMSSHTAGIGAGGGGGAVAYMSSTVTQSTTFTINVGRGGSGGDGFKESTIFNKATTSGHGGSSGQGSSVYWGSNSLVVSGGGGGGDLGGNRTGGRGGSATSGLSANQTAPGNNGANGSQDSYAGGTGGSTGTIRIGSFNPFPESGNVTGAGVGGSGGRDKDGTGSTGGNGKVIIVITEL
jgi:hypothetical protein